MQRKEPVLSSTGCAMWECRICKIPKPESDYYKLKKASNGLQYMCKVCFGKALKKYPKDKEKERVRCLLKSRKQRAESPEKYRKYWMERYRKNGGRKKYLQKIRARESLHKAVKFGKIIKPDVCVECGSSGRIEAHHADYSRPLMVTWLCCTCHGKRHRKQSL
jgi:hypothetical protein